MISTLEFYVKSTYQTNVSGDIFRHTKSQKLNLPCTLTGGDAITELVNQERQQKKQKHHKDEEGPRMSAEH